MMNYYPEKDIVELVNEYGKDILESTSMQSEKNYIQHGNISCYEHSLSVTYVSVILAQKYSSKHNITIDMKSLVRGALLHDYFLYDWHVADKSHRLHGYTHAKKSLHNACRDFNINTIEKDIIYKHMFPLNISRVPKYKESTIVCVADKICAFCETFSIDMDRLIAAN